MKRNTVVVIKGLIIAMLLSYFGLHMNQIEWWIGCLSLNFLVQVSD